MAKVTGPLFSMRASGAFGEIVFDRRGIVRPKGIYHDPQTASQGNFRQTMMVAQKCVKACGPQTRQLLREAAPEPARWSAYLVQQLIGANRAAYLDRLAAYEALAEADRTAWDAAAQLTGLYPIDISYSQEPAVPAGAQLYLLAVTVHYLQLYPELDSPTAAEAAIWQSRLAA